MKRPGIEGARPTVRPTSLVLLLWGSTFKKSPASTSCITFYFVESLYYYYYYYYYNNCNSVSFIQELFWLPILMIRRAQAGSCWPLTSAAPVRSQISSCGIYGGQSGTENGNGFRFAAISIIPLPLCLIITFYKFHTFVSFKMFFTRKNRKST